ncbi:LmbU family transcriptional regulator [Streptomyces sp. NPDC054796]
MRKVTGPTLRTNGVRTPEKLRIGPEAAARRTFLELPPDLPLESWQRVGRQLFLISDSSSWWIGDWIVFGKHMFPDRYRQAIAETQLDYQTLRNYAWVASRFPVTRRRDTLSFAHHLEVAGIPDPEQQDLWLRKAEQGNWSRNKLRMELRKHRKYTEEPDARTSKAVVEILVSEIRKAQWENAARDEGMELVNWITSVLDGAASVDSVP